MLHIGNQRELSYVVSVESMMTQHVRKLSILPRNSGFRAGVVRGMAASDLAIDPDLASVQWRAFRAGPRYDLQTLREDFQNAERRFFYERSDERGSSRKTK